MANRRSLSPLAGRLTGGIAATILIVGLLVAFSAIAPGNPGSLSFFAKPRAVYLVAASGQAVLSDVQAHPEIKVVHSFDELASATHSQVAIWIDSGAAPLVHDDWLNEAPQAWYPLVLVGDNNSLRSFRDTLQICCFLGPIVDWRTVRTEPGFSVIQREDSGGPLPVFTFGRSYDQAPTAGDILAITNALLAGRLQTTPMPAATMPGAPTLPPTATAPAS